MPLLLGCYVDILPYFGRVTVGPNRETNRFACSKGEDRDTRHEESIGYDGLDYLSRARVRWLRIPGVEREGKNLPKAHWRISVGRAFLIRDITNS
jgi:hypothetical protein